ncbi:DUF6412 domain-containing protein [Kutzneria sp. 744]|uniref:DUF6412 domain-containing protein n=1 Tax=Kutzneria sp. (strain 744) TaxID=345341 RepID=UPI0003EEBEF8|nr:DUF6412 domain-containing protein [Kutzneria sp. 744]EWM09920.1 hypothetical protein KUTG_00224 [Kutzneria sp. 744]
MHDLVTAFTTLMTVGPGLAGLILFAGVLVAALAIHLCSTRHADHAIPRTVGLATREQARSRRVLRQQDPDAAGHTRSRAPSAA